MHHILIVDDNLTNLEQINIQIEDEYDISLAKSGAQALQICRKATPDLVLLDIEMPDMDGFETLGRIKADPAISHIPVIFLTASPNPETEVRAIKAGAADFVSKPVERELLLHSIETQLLVSSARAKRDDMARDLEDKLLLAFADIIEHRNENRPRLAGRSSRYVRILCSSLMDKGLYPEDVNPRTSELMTRAAPLHDFGKISIQDIILLKPSILNDEEFSLMKTHTVLGEDLLKRLFDTLPVQDFHAYAVVMARSHHERWDGKGYPDGLTGGEIPVCARIMAVCDVFDALTDTRTYKKAMGAEEALRTISAGRGTFFDPAVCDAFLDRADELTVALEEGSDG